MRLLELSRDDPAENLALDEALLEECETAPVSRPREMLRLWEFNSPVVVVGRSSRARQEVDVAACQQRAIPILRRDSGGAAIVAGPGCLMYSLVLCYQFRPELRAISDAHCFAMGKMAQALNPLIDESAEEVTCAGASDLVLAGRKFSGNSMRAKQNCFLYHGTILYDFPLDLVGQYLFMPPRQPDYRASRKHTDFLANLPIDRERICEAIARAWNATDIVGNWPRQRTEKMSAQKYARHDWIFRR